MAFADAFFLTSKEKVKKEQPFSQKTALFILYTDFFAAVRKNDSTDENSKEATISQKLSLGELGSPTGGLEAVFLTLFHTRITGQEARLFEYRTVCLFIDLQKRSGQTMADGAGLTGDTAAGHIALDVKTAQSVG